MVLALPLHGASIGDSLLVYWNADRKWHLGEIIEVSGDHDCEILYEDGERDRISLDQVKFIVRRNWKGSIRDRKKRGDDSLQTIKNILFDLEDRLPHEGVFKKNAAWWKEWHDGILLDVESSNIKGLMNATMDFSLQLKSNVTSTWWVTHNNEWKKRLETVFTVSDALLVVKELQYNAVKWSNARVLFSDGSIPINGKDMMSLTDAGSASVEGKTNSGSDQKIDLVSVEAINTMKENTVMRRSSRLQKKGLAKCTPIPCSNQREGLSEAPCLSIQSPLCSDEIRSHGESSSDSLSVSLSSQPHEDFDRKYSADRPLVLARHRSTSPKKRKQGPVQHVKASQAKRSRRSCLPHQIEYSNGIGENTVMRRSGRLQKKGLAKCIPIPCSNQRESLSDAPCLSIQSPLCSDEIRSLGESSSDSLPVSPSSQPHESFDRKYSADRPLVRARHRATSPKKRKQGLVQHVKASQAKRSRRSCLPHQIEYSNGIAGDGGDNQKVGLYGLSGRMLCSICQTGVAENFMLRCVGIGCFYAFHTFCLYPPLQQVPEMDWLCPYCKDDPFFMGMITEDRKPTPKKIGSIIGRRRIVINRKKNVLQDQFLIKWELFSHHHDSWVPMEWVKLIDRVRMHRFQDKNPIAGDSLTVIDHRKTEWFKIDRVIACRRKFNAHNVCEILNLSQASQDSREFEFLVKWMGLDYSDATWESSCKEELLIEMGKLVHRHQRAIERSDNYCWESHVPQLDVQPSYLKGGILFDYQMRGLNWILNNFISRRNVILADEMGLGKTVQVVSFVHCMMQEKLTGNPVLIVAPKNILFHWEKEFCHWAEELNFVIYQGERASRRCIRDYEFLSSGKKVLFDVLITNYELILSDSHVLRKFKWSAIIIDEAHKLKNLDCKLGRCLKQYTTDFRLLLTGTPLQNTLLELFALLHFLDSEEFSDPRAKAESFSNIGMGLADGNALDYDTRISQIHELLSHRMLRRMKLDVLPRLIPVKKWVEVPCALTDFQRVLYINLLTKNYDELNKGIHSGRKITLNFLLMELRKCCNHPYLFPGQELGHLSREVPVSLVASSGKLQLLEKLLPKLKERGNRVLLFSQMTKMLDILEDFLLFLGLAYFRIDGTTSMSARQQQMKEFNSPESTVFIFLISTRAGGLGIDLPSADRVIIYDPDFNPFMDLQAQSRAHRIGQTRPVVVYQLITKCSVEEKILQKSKKKLAVENMVMNPTRKLKVDELHSVLLHGARKILSKKFTHATSIHYDDKAIETLLALDPAPGDKCTPEENGYLGAIESFVPGSENKELPPSPKAQEWQEIFGPIKDLGKSEKLGRGKRQRKEVKYVYDDGSESDSDEVYSSDSISVETSADSSTSGYESEDHREDI